MFNLGKVLYLRVSFAVFALALTVMSFVKPLGRLRFGFGVAAAFGFLFVIASATHPALANTTGQDFLNIGTYVNQVVGVMTGPIAKLVACGCVIGGVVAFAAGNEIGHGVRQLGVVAIGVAVLIGLANLMNSFTGALI